MKGIWISTDLIDEKISWIKKALLSEISQLEILDKGCIASNAHFSNKFNITNQGVSKALNELSKDEYIIIDNAQTKRNFGRKITINFGKSAINFSKSAIHESGESKEKKPSKKTLKGFIELLKEEVSIKSKVTTTKDTKKLFDSVQDKDRLFKAYITHQLTKKEFAQRFTPFLLDYAPTSSNEVTKENMNNSFLSIPQGFN